MSGELLRERVERYLDLSDALETVWGRPVTGALLQAEIDRLASSTRSPESSVRSSRRSGDDPALIAETLARQTLAEREARGAHEAEGHGSRNREDAPAARGGARPGFEAWWMAWRSRPRPPVAGDRRGARARILASEAREPHDLDGLLDADLARAGRPGAARFAYGDLDRDRDDRLGGGRPGRGAGPASPTDTGGRYNPATDSWTPTSTGPGVPSARHDHTAVWTGG